TAADPFPGAQLGQTIGAASARFSDVPANLQHSVTFTIDAETFSQAGAAFGIGDGISTTTVLTQSFAAADLVGRPVTIGQFVNSNTFGFVLTETTNTHSPFLLVGQDAADPNSDVLIRGTDFQEVLTNFPLASSVLTGLFAHITIASPGGATKTFDKTLFDRIGFAGRNGATTPLSVDPGSEPALSADDLTTFNVLGALQDDSIIHAWATVNDSKLASLKAIAPLLPNSDPTTPEQDALQQQASNLSRDLMINTQRVLTANFARS